MASVKRSGITGRGDGVSHRAGVTVFRAPSPDLLQCTATLLEQWAVGLLQYTATLPKSSKQWIFFGTLQHYWGAVGNGSPLVHYDVDLVPHTTTRLGSSGQEGSFCTPPECSGALPAHALCVVAAAGGRSPLVSSIINSGLPWGPLGTLLAAAPKVLARPTQLCL